MHMMIDECAQFEVAVLHPAHYHSEFSGSVMDMQTFFNLDVYICIGMLYVKACR